MNLLRTRDGDYAAACSLDFSKPPRYYDTFALRDSEGHEPVTLTYPYFRSRASRKAIMAHEPVPVQSCWNGMGKEPPGPPPPPRVLLGLTVRNGQPFSTLDPYTAAATNPFSASVASRIR